LIVALLIVASVVRQCRSSAAEYQVATVTRGAIAAVTATDTCPVVNVQVGSQVSANVSSCSRF
jgi:hypothetical protein